MKNFLDKMFKYQLKIQKLMYFNKVKGKILKISVALVGLIVMLVAYSLNMSFYTRLFCIFLSSCLILLYIFMSECSTSLKHFFVFGFTDGMIIIVLYYLDLKKLILSYYGEYEYEYTIISYLVFVMVMILFWSLLSSVTNYKISKIANLIFASFNLIILYLNDYFISLIPDKLIDTFFDYDYLLLFSSLGITSKDFIQLLTAIVFVPMLIANVAATLASELKKYWIEKYNNGQDITLELIRQTKTEDLTLDT